MSEGMKAAIVLGSIYIAAIIALAAYSLSDTNRERLACEAQGRVFVTKIYGKVLYHACVDSAAAAAIKTDP